MLVETVSIAQANKLLIIKKLGDFNIEVTSHKAFYECKGVIYCKDLLNCKTEEICIELLKIRRFRSEKIQM